METVEHGYRVERRVEWVGWVSGGVLGGWDRMGGARGRVERTEYVGDCGGTAKRGMKSAEGRVRASTSARGWLEGAEDESELPEGGLRVRWNGANVVRGSEDRDGREGGRDTRTRRVVFLG